ncbi:hypothetical protein CLV84_0285 [Neolewinella xylanilytica]|uniref:DUF5723 domain-containing protein n=1 Tax=Neolewinella xylanilytica TaxID=1514080 RepID=A0A2S6I774_9BACT|nr:DUF5723 family protein [Neolewinella xylanilytica]PPK87345.1 hypothetical protein CLV84_0285 [Neolewinella xylanilytica]
MRKSLLLLPLLLAATLDAQNLTAPLLSGSWQSTYHNPAMVHFLPTTFTVGLPGIANDLRLQNVEYGDVFVKSGGQQILNLAAWAGLAEERNAVQDVYSIETIGAAARRGNFGYQLYHRLRVNGDADYPRSFINLVALGNAAFIGQTVDIAPRGGIVSYQEVGASFSYAVNDQIAIGGRVKYLAGVSSIEAAEGGTLELGTGTENYTLTLDKDLTLNSVRAFAFRSLDDFDLTYNPSRLQPGDLFTPNNGFAFDIGVAVNLDRLRLNASATDLGAGIDWKADITTLRFEGTSTFSGLDILGDLLRDSVSLDRAVDSLVTALEPVSGATAYRSNIAASIFLGGEYDLTEKITAGALLTLEDRLGELVPAFAITGRYTLTDWLKVGLNLNHRSGIRTNLGLHALATPGRFQLFAASDKLLSLLSSGNSSVAGIRLGAAMTLGERRSSGAFRP